MISEATFQLLLDWECVESIRTMVFDTTSVNTGHLSAACITIQTKIGRQLLWCPCRHHIGEILLTHVWDSLKIEVSRSPEISVFKRFRENFPKLECGNPQEYHYATENPKAPEVIRKCSEMLSSSNVLRGDYKELLELVLMYLEQGRNVYPMHRPGALHKARWMAKIIYSVKLFLLKDVIHAQLPRGRIFASGQIVKLQHFVDFVVYVYVEWWCSACQSQDAPLNDLDLFRNIMIYSDDVISESAIKSLSRHTWYLTDELVLLSLFSDRLPSNEKTDIVKKLLQLEKVESFHNRQGSGFGKPVLPRVSSDSTLASFVTECSWNFFQLLGIKTDFLTCPIETWQFHPSFQSAKIIISNLRVVNDSAERGVKLGYDFLSVAQTEKIYQNVLQVVENDRARVADQRKRRKCSESEKWFLYL